MVDEKIAKQQFAQFRGMPGEPSGPNAKHEIRDRIDVLAARARSEAHCEAIAQRMLETLHFFPTIADIVQTVGAVLDPQSTAAIAQSRSCTYCRGDGWISKQAPFGVDVSYPCDHTGRIPEGKGVTMSAQLQDRYLREMEESRAREQAFHEARESGKLDTFEKNSAQKRRDMKLPPRPERPITAPPASEAELDRIKALRDQNRQRLTLEITSEDAKRL